MRNRESDDFLHFLHILFEGNHGALMERIRENEPLSKWTSMKVGGPAAFFVEPETPKEAAVFYTAAIRANIPVFILGNGTNVVISDEGIDGLMIRMGKSLSKMWLEEKDGVFLVHSYAGALLSDLANFCADNELTGMEFASGIPGTVGGAVLMNAGAYGPQMSDVVYQSTAVEATGDWITLSNAEHEYGYRSSVYTRKDDCLLLFASFLLKKGNEKEIREKMKELNEKRAKSQPLTMPSAGSMFKRPEGYFAGTLIQDAGLKGVSVGDAQVSEKHAGFIVNKGSATARDVASLVKKVQNEVLDRFGVRLETEPKFIGEFDVEEK